MHTGASGALLRNQQGVLDHVQNVQIHVMYAKFHTVFSVRISDQNALPWQGILVLGLDQRPAHWGHTT